MITIEVFNALSAQGSSSDSKGNEAVGTVQLVGWDLVKDGLETSLTRKDKVSYEAPGELKPVAEAIHEEFEEHYQNSSIIPLGGNFDDYYWLLKD